METTSNPTVGMYKKLSILFDYLVYTIAALSVVEILELFRNWIPVIVAVAVGIFRYIDHRSIQKKNQRESLLIEEKIKEQVLRNLQRELETRQLEIQQKSKPANDEEEMVA